MNSGGKDGSTKMRREVLKGAGVLLLLLLLMMWLAGVFVEKVQPGPPVQRGEPGDLKTWKVQNVLYPLLLEQVGTIRGQVEAQVSSRIMAQVKEILVREGESVTGAGATGQPTLLATLDDRDITARLRQAESQLAAAEQGIETARARLSATRAQADSARANVEKTSADYRRFRALAAQNAATGQQLDHVRTQRDDAGARLRAATQEIQAAQSELERIQAVRDAARAALSEAQAMLAYTRIHAPFAGKLIKKMVDHGDMASPGQPLFLIETNQQPELHAYLSESLLPHLRPAQELDVAVDALNRTFTGVLREIVPLSDPATRTVLVKVSLPSDPQLVNGLFGRLRIPHGEYRALTIPAEAVNEVGQLFLVNVIDAGGHPRRRFVTLGQRHDSFVEVLSGIEEHEEVVLP